MAGRYYTWLAVQRDLIQELAFIMYMSYTTDLVCNTLINLLALSIIHTRFQHTNFSSMHIAGNNMHIYTSIWLTVQSTPADTSLIMEC